MAKLLDFKPDSKNQEDISKRFENLLTIDVLYGNTPDLPRLRYAGPQHVFIWDDMKNSNKFQETLQVEESIDYSVEHYHVKTQNNYLPFENWWKTTGEQKFYLPSEREWVDQFEEKDVLNVSNQKPAPVTGRIIRVNLKCMRALDEWYSNGTIFHRQLVAVVVPTHTNVGREMWVWAYTCPTATMGKYNPHERKYSLYGGISPRPIRKVNAGYGISYEVDAYLRTSKETA